MSLLIASSARSSSAPLPPGVRGLTTAEARVRLVTDGPNRLAAGDERKRWKRWLGPLADPMVILLLVAAPTYLLIGNTSDAIVALIAVVPVAAVGWLLEARAERTLEKLRQLTAPSAAVLRDGVEARISADELVVGDVVFLREGDIVPADGRVLELTQLATDESSLTGESLPVQKSARDLAFAGTTVVSGRATVEVTATGPRTRHGEIGILLAGVAEHTTPLQVALGRLVKWLSVVAAVLCALVMAIEVLRGNGWGNAVIAAVSLAIAAIPEEFSLVYGLYLSLGAWRLARDHALVRRLPAVETLGSATVICTDKTGTLTEGRLAVTHVRVPEPSPERERALSEAAVLACEPEPFDPLDKAITAHAEQAGLDVRALHAATFVTDWPFDAADKYVTHVWRNAEQKTIVASKGSLEGILAHARTSASERAWAHATNESLAALGMRVIAVAVGTLPAGTAHGDGSVTARQRDESVLHFAGLVAFSDPIREGVALALAECREAGIRVIMITGDHPATAHAVAEGLSLAHVGADGADVIATGDDLDARDDAQFEALVSSANVFARTRPDQKYRLVEALRARGEVVAMTGDGVNDAPALRAADIGIAMGQRGTDVAREAATMVLLDDNFTTIVRAVRDGRRIYDNLTRAFAYLIAFHPPLLLAAFLVPLLGKPLLLLPIHLVLLELLLHPIVSLVFEADDADLDVMRRAPRASSRSLGIAALWRPYAVGVTLALGVVACYLGALAFGLPVEEARALGFATILASQPFLLIVERSPAIPIWRAGIRPTKTLGVAIAAVIATILAMVYVPPLAALLALKPFAPAGWLVVIAVSAATTLWSEPFKRQLP
jgi:P-type Ca2+ transporter type 2C